VSELKQLIQGELERLTERDTKRELEHQDHIQRLMQVRRDFRWVNMRTGERES
jgi:hypothetical protein